MDEREFELVNIIGAELGANQRDLSRHMELSLGMTNMLIRRLLAKGYIRIKQLNKKKVEYILTPKGFAEKMQKSVKYTLKTINSIGLIKNCLSEVLQKFHSSGVRKFYILGESDLAGLIEMVLQENFKQDFSTVHIRELSVDLTDGAILVCQEGVKVPDGFKGVNMVEELARDNALTMDMGEGKAFLEVQQG
ncbi:MAG: winged helix-turn-helix transcriptional regulator [Candidatus Omnitrophica bacterium]|nr:winged helix-turn-helix transcriptional regulator [Candidatus Omnitrophota bacterium]